MSTLDRRFYPVIDAIIASAPPQALLALRATCRAFRDRIDRRRLHHIVLRSAADSGHVETHTQGVGALPRSQLTPLSHKPKALVRLPSLLARCATYTQILDQFQDLGDALGNPPGDIECLLPNVHTVRRDFRRSTRAIVPAATYIDFVAMIRHRAIVHDPPSGFMPDFRTQKWVLGIHYDARLRTLSGQGFQVLMSCFCGDLKDVVCIFSDATPDSGRGGSQGAPLKERPLGILRDSVRLFRAISRRISQLPRSFRSPSIKLTLVGVDQIPPHLLGRTTRFSHAALSSAIRTEVGPLPDRVSLSIVSLATYRDRVGQAQFDLETQCPDDVLRCGSKGLRSAIDLERQERLCRKVFGEDDG